MEYNSNIALKTDPHMRFTLGDCAFQGFLLQKQTCCAWKLGKIRKAPDRDLLVHRTSDIHGNLRVPPQYHLPQEIRP